jgi:site-specific DNA recombinase
MRFLEAQPAVPKMANGSVSNERVKQILTNPIYAGIVHVPSWNVAPRLGKHEPLISIETFNEIQDRLKGKARGAVRADVSADFPLRGHICCPSCGTSSDSELQQGQTGCCLSLLPLPPARLRLRGKSYAREKVEGAFEALLRSVTPAKELVDLAAAAFRNHWNKQAMNADQSRKAIEKELAEIDRKVKQLLDRIVEAESPTVISAYENRIAELESTKLLLKDKMARAAQPKADFDESFRNALAFLASPWNLWKNGHLRRRRWPSGSPFLKHLVYDPKGAVRNSILSIPFKTLYDLFWA